MIVTLGRLLIRRVAGCAGHAAWRTLAGHVAELKPRTIPHVGEGPIQGDPFDGLDQTPDLENTDCLTWKVIDAHYTANAPRLRDAWRHTPARPKQSTYDAYMKYSLPHALRGLAAPDYIPAKGSKLINIKQYGLNNLTPEQLTQYKINELIPTTAKTRLRGLHYAAAARYVGKLLPGPPPVFEYRITWYVEALDLDRPSPSTFWTRLRLRYDYEPDAVGAWTAWTKASRYAIGFHESPQQIQGLDIDYAPPARNTDGTLTTPEAPDVTQSVPIRNLHRDPPITTWPRFPHSTRGYHLAHSLWWEWQQSLLAGGYWQTY
jgi:hypothetical protein